MNNYYERPIFKAIDIGNKKLVVKFIRIVASMDKM